MANYIYKIADSIGGRQEQQDFAGIAETGLGLLAVVCDGMGGAKGGATASRMAVQIILQDIKTKPYNSPATALVESIKKANAEIFKRSQTDDSCRGMGTTVTAIILQKQKATIAHAGDSRIYQLRNTGFPGKGLTKVLRTNDHSKVFELVKRGIISEEQARLSDDSNIILRALGLWPTVDVELKDNIPYLKGDRFLLCTDGVSGAAPDNYLLNVLNQRTDVETTVNNLIATIDQIGYQNGGGHDNLTAALIECGISSTLKPPVSMNTKILIASLAGLLLLSLGYIGLSMTNRISPEELETLKQANGRYAKQVDSLLSINRTLNTQLMTLRPKKDDDAQQTPSNRRSAQPDQVTDRSMQTGGGSIIPDTNSQKRSVVPPAGKKTNTPVTGKKKPEEVTPPKENEKATEQKKVEPEKSPVKEEAQ